MINYYKDYPIYIRKELDDLRDRRNVVKKPKKKEFKYWRRIKVGMVLLRNKASK